MSFLGNKLIIMYLFPLFVSFKGVFSTCIKIIQRFISARKKFLILTVWNRWIDICREAKLSASYLQKFIVNMGKFVIFSNYFVRLRQTPNKVLINPSLIQNQSFLEFLKIHFDITICVLTLAVVFLKAKG